MRPVSAETGQVLSITRKSWPKDREHHVVLYAGLWHHPFSFHFLTHSVVWKFSTHSGSWKLCTFQIWFKELSLATGSVSIGLSSAFKGLQGLLWLKNSLTKNHGSYLFNLCLTWKYKYRPTSLIVSWHDPEGLSQHQNYKWERLTLWLTALLPIFSIYPVLLSFPPCM